MGTWRPRRRGHRHWQRHFLTSKGSITTFFTVFILLSQGDHNDDSRTAFVSGWTSSSTSTSITMSIPARTSLRPTSTTLTAASELKLSFPSRRPLQKRRQKWDLSSRDDNDVQTNHEKKDVCGDSRSQPDPRSSTFHPKTNSTPDRKRSVVLSRRPRYYWKDVQNIRNEIIEQWKIALSCHDGDNSGDDFNDDDDFVDMIPDPPPIPNDTLLLYWKRYDLRAAIRTYEGIDITGGVGRVGLAIDMMEMAAMMADKKSSPQEDNDDDNGDDDVRDLKSQWEHRIDSDSVPPSLSSAASADIEGLLIVPGKWKDAIVKFPIVKRVVEMDPDLNLDRPPTINGSSNNPPVVPSVSNRRKGRKPIRYWSQQQVLSSFYDILQHRYDRDKIPKVWMPQLSYIEDQGLRQTLIKFFGKKKKKTVKKQRLYDVDDDDDDDDEVDEYDGMTNGDVISSKIGLIPYDEWNYFERQFDLMVSLKEYLDEQYGGDYSYFPRGYTALPSLGYRRLFRLIQDFGGRTIIAGRFGMDTTEIKTKTKTTWAREYAFDLGDLKWGAFDLETGIVLMGIVRQQQMELEPPLDFSNPSHKHISMPSPSTILRMGAQGQILNKKILQYGGYENVGRRLGLAIDYNKVASSSKINKIFDSLE